MQPIEKQRGGRVRSLMWPPFGWESTTTNQKLAFVVGKILGRARDRGGTCWGAFRYRLGAAHEVTKNKKNKIRRGLRWPPIGKKTHNNQPKTGGCDGGDYGREERRAGGVGKRDIIVFWRGEV